MKGISLLLFLALSCCVSAFAQDALVRLCEPWQSAYTGDDARGSHVIALWQFARGAETEDASGNGHTLQITGATINPKGRFGPCLESFCGYPVVDKRHAAVAASHPALSPKGAFTLEMWICPKPELSAETGPDKKTYPQAFLLDKKYVSKDDYQFILDAADKAGLRRLVVNLGFGDGSDGYISQPVKYETGVWYHVAFTYNGLGEGRFYRDGVPLGGGVHRSRRDISPGSRILAIGDRTGSLYHGFPGYIAQVRISKGVLEFRPAGFALVSDRAAFVRMEKAPALQFTLTNLQKSKLTGASARISIEGLPEKTFAIPDLDSGAVHKGDYALDTSLRPGEYKLKAALSIPGDKPYTSEESFSVTIAPRPLPLRMPVVMWGVGGGDAFIKELPRLKSIGFTHCLGLSADFGKIWEAGKPTEPGTPEKIAETRRTLDLALANDFGLAASLSPGHWVADNKPEFRRVNRDGKPFAKHDICGRFDQVRDFCYNVGASVAQAYGAFPAFDAAMVHTEVRDASLLCFHDGDKAAFKKETGLDIPAEALSKAGVEYAKLKDFPEDRVIPDNHPLYVYYRWFWKDGDGWNRLHTALHDGLKSTGRKDLWTWFDPAVRVASVYGSGGGVDVLSQWTYSYPDPIRIAMPTDELFRMAAPPSRRAGPQSVMKMIQIIWYRSQTAPVAAGPAVVGAPKSVWEDTDPDSAFITIAPMHLREAFWTKIARPIRGVMYHGWQSLVSTDSPSSYRYTHPQTQHELRRLVDQVVKPLGPTLLQVPDRQADVAFLESFASQMFARRGSYGWSHQWGGDVYLILQYAQLQPEIVYDETVQQQGLDKYKVLVMADCDVLIESVVKKVKEFQARGGIVVGDERLSPAVKPDILLPSYERVKKADADRAALLAKAAELRKALDEHYIRRTDSSNPNVITRCRTYSKTDYVFAVNDLREYGDYVGHHGLVMENGLPSETVLSVLRETGHVYDLVAGQAVASKQVKQNHTPLLTIPAALGPCEGRLFMVTDQPIDSVRLTAPTAVARGAAADVKITIADPQGAPLAAVVPVRLDILDPAGREAEFTGYYGVKDGHLAVKLDIAPNDTAGIWTLRAKELASGKTAVHYLRVTAR